MTDEDKTIEYRIIPVANSEAMCSPVNWDPEVLFNTAPVSKPIKARMGGGRD